MDFEKTLHRPMRNQHGMIVFKRVLVMIALLCASLFVLGYWLLSSESGARATFSMLSRLPPVVMPVAFDGIHGKLTGPLAIDRLVIDNAAQRITVDNVRLDWQPSALFVGRLHVVDLRVHNIHFLSKVAAEQPSAQLPVSLAIPVALQIDRIQVDGGTIGIGAIDVMQLGGIALAMDYDKVRYRLKLSRLGLNVTQQSSGGFSFASNLSGGMTLGDKRPFSLRAIVNGETSGKVKQKEIDSVAALNLSGSLETIDANVSWNLNQAQLSGNAVLRPFSKLPLVRAAMRGEMIDLSALDTSLPKTQIDARITASQAGGTIDIANTDAGAYSGRKLPISNVGIVFRQTPGTLDFKKIDISLGSSKLPHRSAGHISGSGRYANAALSLELMLANINLQGLEADMRATNLSGKVRVTHAKNRQEISAALTEPLYAPSVKTKTGTIPPKTLALMSHATLTNSTVKVDRFDLKLGDATVEAQGLLALTENRAFELSGRMSRFRLQDLGAFSGVPELLLNGRFELKGTQVPSLAGDLSFVLSDSQLGRQPLRGRGKATLRASRISIPELVLEAGANSIDVHGTLESKASTLSFQIAAPQLTQLGSAFDGSATVSGTITGTIQRPRVQTQWQANHLRIPGGIQIGSTKGSADLDVNRQSGFLLERGSMEASARTVITPGQSIASLQALLRFSPQPQAPLTVELQTSGVIVQGIKSAKVELGIHGTTAQHALTATMVDERQRLRVAAHGGLKLSGKSFADAEWKGSIDTVESDGDLRARLTSPAVLQASAHRLQLDRFIMEGDGALLRIDQFLRDRDGVKTRGKLEHLSVSKVIKLLSPTAPLSSDLLLRGEWNIQIADGINGSATIERESGDLVMVDTSSVPLGLQKLSLRATGTNNHVSLKLQAAGRQLGRIDLQGETTLQKIGAGFALDQDSPISGRLLFDSASLAWIGPLLSPSLIIGGKIQSTVSIAGSIARPKLTGSLDGTRLKAAMPDSGIEFRNGVLKAIFSDDQLTIQKLSFGSTQGASVDSGVGQISLTGPIKFSNGEPSATLAIEANRFSLFDRPDRKLVVSGSSSIKLTHEKLDITGQFRTDAGDIDIGREDRPALSSDVVIDSGKSKKSAPIKRSLSLDVGIDLGDGIVLKGRGLDAVMVGGVRFTNDSTTAGNAPALRANGTVQIEKGSFSAYGKALAIEQGQLRFDGALNNPALNILAMRRGTVVEAGVTVRGTVLAPRIALVSEPVVPDAEKLSWLVLGRGLDTASGSDAGALQSAASSLLSQGAASGVQSQIATAFGLDDVKLGTSDDNLQQRIVTVGKRLSSRLYVGFEQGLQSANSVVHLKYSLTRTLTLEVEAGARSALSIFYNIAFD
jgi:translocation and assembly module TamB